MPIDVSDRRASQDQANITQGSRSWEGHLMVVSHRHDMFAADSFFKGSFFAVPTHSGPALSVIYDIPGRCCLADVRESVMMSLAIGSCLMIAVTVRYVQSRQKFTQWSPPNFNSATSGSEAGYSSATMTGTQTSSRPATKRSTGRTGLYDRWLMVRFTIAWVLLA